MTMLCRKQYYAYFWCANTGRLLKRVQGNTRTLLTLAIKAYREVLESRGFDYTLQDDGDFSSVYVPSKEI